MRVEGRLVHVSVDAVAVLGYALLFVVALAAAARAPRYAVGLLVGLAPFAFYFDVGTTTLTLSKVTLAGTLCGLLVRGISFQIFRSAPFLRLSVAAAIMALTTALSIEHAQHVEPAVRETLKACEYLLLFAVVYAAHRLDPDPRTLRIAITGTVLAVTALALFQEWHGAPSRLLIGGQTIPRIAGPLEGPNQLAGYLGIAVPLLVALAMQRPDLLTMISLAAASAALVLTFSRAGLISTIVAVSIILVVASRARVKPVLATFFGGLAAGFGGAACWGIIIHSPAVFWLWGLESANPGGVGTRSQLWHAAITLWRSHPLFGIGAGNFELAIGSTGLPAIRTHANSLYLQNLAEQGLPGIAATLLLVWQSIATFVRDARASPFILGALAASVGLALHQLVDLLVFYPKVGGWWWIVMAVGAAEIAALRQARDPAFAGRREAASPRNSSRLDETSVR